MFELLELQEFRELLWVLPKLFLTGYPESDFFSFYDIY